MWKKRQPGRIRKTTTKVNRRVLPLLIGLFFFTLLARNNIANAADQMLSDLGMTQNQYSTGVSVFFITYVLFQIPGNILLKKLNKPSLTFGVVLISMGILGCAFVLLKNLFGFVVLRLLVGLFEACIYPGILYYLTRWYPVESRSRAIASVGIAGGLSGALGGVLAYGILQMDGILGLRGWQWLFLVEGVPAILFGVVIFIYLPDTPAKCNFLTDAEKEKLETQNEEPIATQFEWDKLFELLQNWRLWLMGLAFAASGCVTYGIGYYLPALIGQFGYDPIISQLLTVPATVPGAFCGFLYAYLVQKYKGKVEMFALLGCMIASIFFAMLALAVANHVGVWRFVVLCIANMVGGMWLGPFITWVSAELKGSSTMAAVGLALTNSMGNIGGIIGPKIMSHTIDAEGHFGVGLSILGCVHFITLTIVVVLLITKRKTSKKQPDAEILPVFLTPAEAGPEYDDGLPDEADGADGAGGDDEERGEEMATEKTGLLDFRASMSSSVN